MQITEHTIEHIIAKYKPTVIGVCGDRDRRIVLDMLYYILDKAKPNQVVTSGDCSGLTAAASIKNTIIFKNQVSKNIFKQWLRLKKILWSHDKDYPQFLVLDYAVDEPGQMKELLKIIKPDIGVFTSVTDRNREFFKTLERETKEKGYLVTKLAKENQVVINGDDVHIDHIRSKIKASITDYGFNKDNRVAGHSAVIEEKTNAQNSLAGMRFKVTYDGNTMPVFLPSVLGVDYIRAVLATIAVGALLDLNPVNIIEWLRSYGGVSGIMQIQPAVKQALLVNDSYDADPYAVATHIETLKNIQGNKKGQKFLVLGEMTALPEWDDAEHAALGVQAGEGGIDVLIAVGKRAYNAIEGARSAGMPEDRTFYFDSAVEAGKFLQNRLEAHDLVLITGGKESKVAKIVKEISA